MNRMNVLSLILLLSITLSYVCCDPDVGEIQKRIQGLMKLNATQLHERIVSNFDFTNKVAEDGAITYEKEELKVVANVLRHNVDSFKAAVKEMDQFLSKETNVTNKFNILVGMAAASETMRWDDEERLKHPDYTVNVTESVAVLETNFSQLRIALNNRLQWVADMLFKANKFFWSHFHSKLQGFYTNVYIEAEVETNKLNGNIKAKTLTVLNKQIEGVLSVTSVIRTDPPKPKASTPAFYED